MSKTKTLSEPPWVCWRRFRLGYAASFMASICAWKAASASAGGMGPMGSSGRRWLNQSTHSLLRAELRFEGGELHRLEAAPGAPPTDRLGLEEADDRLRQRVVEGVPRPEPTEGSMPASARRPGRAGWQDAATRGPSARSARHPWRAGAGGWLAPARPRRSPPWPSGSPRLARDAPRVGVDERASSAIGPRTTASATWAKPCHVAARVEVAHPGPVRGGRGKLPPHPVERARCSRVLDRPRSCLAPRPAQPPAPASAAPRYSGRPRRPRSGAGARASERRESPKFSACTRAISGRSSASPAGAV